MPPAALQHDRCQNANVLLLDIEGTISSISFVKDVLYTYAFDRLSAMARNSWDDPAFQNTIAEFPEETRRDAETLLAHVADLMRRDVKATYLKQLQGKLWKIGYDDGELKTPLFDDVIPTLETWKRAGKTLAIFSSGSVQAQLQFFSVVEHGQTTRDLKPLFAAHFDPTIAGSKLEKGSYEKICAELGYASDEILFLTDNVLEAEAAHDAGVYAVLVDRPGNATLSADARERFAVITSLAELP